MRSIYPVLRYTDPPAAIGWLEKAFGFERHQVHETSDGTIVHAEMSFGDDMIMLGKGKPDGGAGIYVAVDDPDAHHDRAKAAGAEISQGLVDQPYGSREYAAVDLEGNPWYFGTYRP